MDEHDDSEKQVDQKVDNEGYEENQEHEDEAYYEDDSQKQVDEEVIDNGYEEYQEYEDEAYNQEGYDENNYDEEEMPIFKEIPRFDPSVKDHKKFEVAQPKGPLNIKKDVHEKEVNDKKSEKMYFVDQSFKDKLSGNSDFSLLSLFGPKEPKTKTIKEDYNVDSRKYVDLYDKHMDYHEPISEYNRRMESEMMLKSEKKAQGVLWDRSLFFKTDDSRLSEGVAFFNKVEKVDPEKFKAKRSEIKYMVKSKIQMVKSTNNTHNTKLRAPKNKLYALKTKFNKKRKFFNKPKGGRR